jgi:hypothetical protein
MDREALERELAELEAKNAAAPGWGAAVGARHERINGIRKALAADPAQHATAQPLAYFYERATARTSSGKPALWQNELTFGKPDTHEFIRNVVPLYAAALTPAGKERQWCTACGTVSGDGVCDCNRYGQDRQPQFVNYADAMQEDARKLALENARLVSLVESAVASFRAIQDATLKGKVCDDVAWFSDIETLHDYCADVADRLSNPSTVRRPEQTIGSYIDDNTEDL